MIQLITCGAGARYAGLSDRRDLLLKYDRTTSYEGQRLRNGLKAYVSVYTKDAPYTKMPPEPYDEKCDIYLDARVFSDPDGDRDHTGRHQSIIARMAAHTAWTGWLRAAHCKLKYVLRNWNGGPIIPVVVFCRSGRHRSVAASELLKGAFWHVEGWEFLPSIHISIDMEDAGCRCKNCRPSREICEIIQSSIALAVAALDLRDGCGASSSA